MVLPLRRQARLREQLAALDALRSQPREASVEPLRKALAQRNNFLVAKAADLVREFRVAQLMPELLSAFERFFENPEKTDPQCWARTPSAARSPPSSIRTPKCSCAGCATSRWNLFGEAAPTLPGLCAPPALWPWCSAAACRKRTCWGTLDLLGDKEKVVRAAAIQAIEQVGAAPAALLLRLRAVLGTDEPEVLGAAYSGMLRRRRECNSLGQTLLDLWG